MDNIPRQSDVDDACSLDPGIVSRPHIFAQLTLYYSTKCTSSSLLVTLSTDGCAKTDGPATQGPLEENFKRGGKFIGR
jgi:hypothetical protein